MRNGLRVTPSEAKQMIDGGDTIILDVVQPDSWRRLDGAVKDALRIEPDEIPGRVGELPAGRSFVAYCT